MRTSLLVPSLLACLALAACASSGARVQTPLESTSWRLVELGGRPALGGGERRAHLRFKSDSASVVGFTGCNRLSGQFTRDGTTLRFGPAITTRMACADPAMNQQEQAFLSALNDTERYAIVGDTLTLFGAAGPMARLLAEAAPATER